MICENSVGDGCASCMVTLSRSLRRTRQDSDIPGHQCPGNDGLHVSAVCEASGGARVVLLAVMAFVVPVVMSVVVVQAIESRVGSAAAAIAGLAAAGLTAVTSAGVVRRFACRSAVTGAGG